jgi:hypothetical protein
MRLEITPLSTKVVTISRTIPASMALYNKRGCERCLRNVVEKRLKGFSAKVNLLLLPRVGASEVLQGHRLVLTLDAHETNAV